MSISPSRLGGICGRREMIASVSLSWMTVKHGSGLPNSFSPSYKFIVGYNYRMNLELVSSMINCKLLRRSQQSSSSCSESTSSPNKQHPAHLVDCSINLFVSIGVDFRSAKLMVGFLRVFLGEFMAYPVGAELCDL